MHVVQIYSKKAQAVVFPVKGCSLSISHLKVDCGFLSLPSMDLWCSLRPATVLIKITCTGLDQRSIYSRIHLSGSKQMLSEQQGKHI